MLCLAATRAMPPCWPVSLPQVCSQELVDYAAERFAVKFTPGLVCEGQAHNIRLSFALYQEHELQEGARRLGAAISSFLQERS